MSTLLLRLAAPLQSWGADSRFNTRATRREPTKSGILGLLGAARGMRRTDPIEAELVGLRFGCRVDQPGRLVRDYQTSARWQEGISQAHSLSTRHYLADAVFVAGVEGERSLLEGLRDALLRPTFDLYLGRRSCPAEGTVVLALEDTGLEESLVSAPWAAAPWYRKTIGRCVSLEIVLDADAASAETRSTGTTETVRDVPLSFDPEHRDYAWRTVVRTWVDTENPDGLNRPDFMAALGGLS